MKDSKVKFESQAIFLNGVKGNLVTEYVLLPNALGGFDWHKNSVNFVKSTDNNKPEFSYNIRAKQLCNIKGKSNTMFEVFKDDGDREVYIGRYHVPSKGVARNATCLKAWLNVA